MEAHVQLDLDDDSDNSSASEVEVELVAADNPTKRHKLVPKDRGKLIVKPKTKSTCWEHFKIYSLDKDWACCNLCNQDVKCKGPSGSNTSHLTDHLRSDHRSLVKSSRELIAKVSLTEEIKAVGESRDDIRKHSKKTLAAFGVFAPKFEKCLIRFGLYLNLHYVVF